MPELVSILIPAYNAERWITDTIRSALGQSWPRKEIIIVDDGSSDDTLSIAKRFESGSLKVLHQKNKGASAARNRALLHAQGDYIQWLDADDLLASDKISEQMKIAGSGRSSPVLLSSAFGKFFWRREKAIFTPDALWQDLSPVDWLLEKFRRNLWLVPASWLVSRRITEKAGPWNEDLSLDDDGEYFCRAVAASQVVRFVRQAKTFYRQSGSSQLSRRCTAKSYASLFLSLTLCVRHLRSLEESERTREASLILLQRLHTYFHHFADEAVLAEKVNSLARELGRELLPEGLAWKWHVLRKLLGWNAAKRVVNSAKRSKLTMSIYWDRLLYRMAYGKSDLTRKRFPQL